MANEIEIRVSKVKPGPVFDQIQRDAKAAGKDIEDSLQKGFRGAEQASDRARKGIGDNLDKAAQEAGDAGEKAGSNFSDRLGSQIEGAGKAGAAAAGVAIGALLLQGLQQSFEETKVGGLLAAQTGQTGAAAGQLGDLAGDIFMDNFGESIAQVGDTMRSLFQTKIIDADAAEADIKKITELTLGMAQITGASVDELTQAVRTMLRTGMADSAEQAFDLIQAGFRDGANAGGDLLDVLTNSSANLRQFGFDGPAAIGSLIQALNAGAPSADAFTGALEELIGNASDGIATFERLGLGGAAFADRLAGGGPKAAQALDQLLDSIRAIQSPAERSATLVELFGEEATALQEAILAVDPSEASKMLGEFGGAAQKASDQASAATPAIETMWKNLQAGANNAVDWFAQSDAIDELRAKAEEASRAGQEGQSEHEKSVRAAADAWKNQGGEIERVIETLDKFISKSHEIASGVLDLSEAQISYQAALDATATALKENGATLDINTEKGRSNQEALNGLTEDIYGQIEAMQEQGASTQEIAGFVAGAREQFVAFADKMGLSAAQANALADKLRLIPGDYTARVHANTEQAASAIRTIHGRLVDLTNRSWIASVAVTGGGGVGGGRHFAGLAAGGPVGAGLDVAHAAEGGARGRLVMTDELGPELKHLPDGSTVVPAGMSRQLMSGMGGGPIQLYLNFGGDQTGPMAVWFKKSMRDGDITLHAGTEPVTVT